MKNIWLRSKYAKYQSSLLLMIIWIFISLFSWEKLFKTGIFVLPILIILGFSIGYELQVHYTRNCSLNFSFLFFRKPLIEFKNFDKSEIVMEQLENKYWAGFLLLENGEKILLDSRPTLDKSTERIIEIFDQMKPYMNNLRLVIN